MHLSYNRPLHAKLSSYTWSAFLYWLVNTDSWTLSCSCCPAPVEFTDCVAVFSLVIKRYPAQVCSSSCGRANFQTIKATANVPMTTTHTSTIKWSCMIPPTYFWLLFFLLKLGSFVIAGACVIEGSFVVGVVSFLRLTSVVVAKKLCIVY